MSRAITSLTGLLAILMAALALTDPSTTSAEPLAVPDARPAEPADPQRPVQRGMIAAEVRRLLGPPKRIARQILYRRSIEQWIYEGPVSRRIDFDCVQG